MNDTQKIVEQLIAWGNNPEWAKEAVTRHIAYLNRVYGRLVVKDAADAIRTIDDGGRQSNWGPQGL